MAGSNEGDNRSGSSPRRLLAVYEAVRALEARVAALEAANATTARLAEVIGAHLSEIFNNAVISARSPYITNPGELLSDHERRLKRLERYLDERPQVPDIGE